jgi:hypothetical protein
MGACTLAGRSCVEESMQGYRGLKSRTPGLSIRDSENRPVGCQYYIRI